MENELLSAAEAKVLQKQLALIDKEILTLKSKLVTGEIDKFSEKRKANKRIRQLYRQKKPILQQIKYSAHYFKCQKDVADKVKIIEQAEKKGK